MTELTYLDSKKKTGDPRFWNRNAPTHYRAVTVFGLVSFPAAIITSLAVVWVWLLTIDRDYLVGAFVLLFSLLMSWVCYFACLSWTYYKLVILSHTPLLKEKAPKKMRVYANGELQYTDEIG